MTGTEIEIGEAIQRAVTGKDPEAANAVISFILEKQRQMSKGLETMSKALEAIQRLYSQTPKQQQQGEQQR